MYIQKKQKKIENTTCIYDSSLVCEIKSMNVRNVSMPNRKSIRTNAKLRNMQVYVKAYLWNDSD